MKYLPLLLLPVIFAACDLTSPERRDYELTFVTMPTCPPGGRLSVNVYDADRMGVGGQRRDYEEISEITLHVPEGITTVVVESTLGWRWSTMIVVPHPEPIEITCR